mmetsp:Transcript_11888/g.21739  ORF Transcript_11888/g.21739 Transcript_11888/m.21739 type:complete len:265 (+) Transcript_11888:793-1587(+)
MKQSHQRGGTNRLVLLALSHRKDFLVEIQEGFPDSSANFLVSRGWLHLALPELLHDCLVQLLGDGISHLAASMPIEDGKVDSQLLHGFVRDIAILQGFLEPRPTLSVDAQTQGFSSDIIALLFLLQVHGPSMYGQRLPVDAKHHHLECTRPSIFLYAWLVKNLHRLLQVDGVGGSASHNVLPVHEQTLLLGILLPQGNYEAKALLGVPLLNATFRLWLLLLDWLWRFRLWTRRLCLSVITRWCSCCFLLSLSSIPAFIKLYKFS